MTDVLKRNNVTVSGSGTETIIFAHGFGCSQQTWRDVAANFYTDYRVVLFDYVGAGQSDLEAYDFERYNTLDGYAQDILDICEALQLEPSIVVGHSVSSMIAMLAAIKDPAFFKKLVFVSPSPYYFNDENYIGGLDKEDVNGLFDMMDSNYLGWSSMLAPLVMGNPDRPELGAALTNSFCATDPAIAKQFARVTFYSDHRQQLPLLEVESLTLQCDHDMLAPKEIGSYIQANSPYNSLQYLKATGHCPHLSAPEETALAIRKYLKQPAMA